MVIPLWPWKVLWANGVSIDIAPRSLAGPSSVSGVTQTVSSDAGIWKAVFSPIPLTKDAQILCFRAISNLLEGRLNPILVPLLGYERRFQPVPDGQLPLYEPVPFSDGVTFSDGSLFQGQVIDVVLVGNIAARAVTANIAINNAGMIQPGQHFSIGERLYRIRTVEYTSDNAATITFRPPAREAASVGARLNFDEPVCRMKLASDAEMDLPLDHNVMGFPSVSFIEDV